jgi:NADPH-dependent glutamate synthase beta subunit-like oxidoreductase
MRKKMKKRSVKKISKKPLPKKPVPDFSLPPMSISFSPSLAIKTGTWRYLTPVYVNKLAPCSEACPAGEDVEAVLALAGEGKFLEAWEKIVQENPLPRICGRVCFHPCEASCNRKEFDEPTSINALERFLGDYAYQRGAKIPLPQEKRSEKIAIIGSGPAGLSCAYHLARLGYNVNIFEAQPQLGGMLRYGIPAYRLPKEVLDQEIENILSLGVVWRPNSALGRDFIWEDLKNFDAIFLATGAWQSLKLRIPGEESSGVISGLEFLKKINTGQEISLGERVAVIGGGNTAMDVARAARRLGAKPLIIYRRTKEEMPAFAEEIAEAEEEGIEFIFLASPLKIISENGKVKGLECLKNTLGPPRKDGRPEPQPITNSNFLLEVETVIPAIGEIPDFSFLPQDLERTPTSLKIKETGAANLPRVFAGGDIIPQPRTVAYAIGSGKKAAMAIDATLKGKEIEEALCSARWGEKGSLSMALYLGVRQDKVPRQVVKFADLNPAYFQHQSRSAKEKLPAHERILNFAEVNLGLNRDKALMEAKRCFNCGVCNLCHNCYLFCPDLAISARPDHQDYEINLEYCKGCCICVAECPRGAISVEVKK